MLRLLVYDFPTSISDFVVENVVEIGAEVAGDLVAEEVISTAIGVAVVEAAPVILGAYAAYGAFELGYEVGELATHVVEYLEDGQSTKDIAKVKTWWNGAKSQVQVVFHPSVATRSPPQNKSSHTNTTTRVTPKSKPTNITVSFVFLYSGDYRNLTNITNHAFPTTKSNITFSPNITNGSPDGMVVGVKVNNKLICSFGLRLGWRPKKGQPALAPPPPPRMHNATWASRVTLITKTNPTLKSSSSSDWWSPLIFTSNPIYFWLTIAAIGVVLCSICVFGYFKCKT